MAKESNQQKALTALLTTNTVKEAAKQAGISPESIYRYLRDPRFLKEYRSHRNTLMEATVGRIQGAADQAVQTLIRNLTSGNNATEVRAAVVIIENALKGREQTEIIERLEALEANANQQPAFKTRTAVSTSGAGEALG